VGSKVVLDDGSSENRGQPLLLHQDRPLLLQDAQVLDDVGHIDCGAPGTDARVDEALAVKESKEHLFCPTGVDLDFDWVSLPQFIYCWDWFFV
jgi:hypothetical protein